jgi:hypothetical protein
MLSSKIIKNTQFYSTSGSHVEKVSPHLNEVDSVEHLRISELEEENLMLKAKIAEMEILFENVQNRCCDGCLIALNLPIKQRKVRPSSLKSSNQKKSSGRGKITGMSPV